MEISTPAADTLSIGVKRHNYIFKYKDVLVCIRWIFTAKSLPDNRKPQWMLNAALTR